MEAELEVARAAPFSADSAAKEYFKYGRSYRLERKNRKKNAKIFKESLSKISAGAKI